MFGVAEIIVVLGMLMCGAALVAAIGVGGFVLLVKLGVIVREAQRPPYLDHGNYTLDQGREVRPEEELRK